MTGVPTVSEMAMLNVTKYVYCTRSLSSGNSELSRSGTGSVLPGDTNPHTVCVLRCLLYDGKGRTEALVERKCKGHNNRKVISNSCVITIGKWAMCPRDWKM